MPRTGSRKCLNCKHYFRPNPRSGGRQRFCSTAACRKASKRHSQKKWREKPENRDYFKGPEHVRRVQLWRQQHPTYGQRATSSAKRRPPLQDPLMPQATDSIDKTGAFTVTALQDTLISQPFVLVGLISQLTGVALQEDIVESIGRLRQLGEDLVSSPKLGERPHDSLTQPSTSASDPPTVQLDRSPSGA